jgi:membrane-associated phospholipid phosphatase
MIPGWLSKLNGHVVGRLLTTVVVISATFQIYWYLNNNLAPRFDLMTPLDRALPFWPWTLLVYQSFFVMLLWAAWVCGAEEFLKLSAAVLLSNLVAYVGFIAFTAHYPRPDVAAIEPAWLRDMFVAMFAQDAPGNTFPSIHVAVTALVGLRLRMRRHGWVWLLWGALVIVSTLTVKQHFIADVLGGIAVALGVDALVFRRRDAVAVQPLAG